MKVLHISNNYPTLAHPIFGVFVKEQVDSLAKLGLENDIFFINGREKGKTEYFKSVFRLRNFLKDKHFDIIHCHHALSAICFILCGRYKNYKSIVSYQNDPANELGGFIFQVINKRTTAAIFKNNSSKVNGFSVFNQPNGVNTNLFRPMDKSECFAKLRLDKNKLYILFVSSNFVRKQKRYDRFLKVLEVLKSKYGLYNVSELKLINVKRELVPFYFNAASLHLLTSDFEGSPNSVKEAMACNLPVVTTNVGNVCDMLKDVNNAYIAEKNSAEELAELAYRALTVSKRANARDVLISKELDIDSVARKISEIYKIIAND